jgi:predicted enzyme related to lactoylglutathione lyase
MFTGITHHGIFVLDQDEALEFYVGKLGLEVSADIDLGFMRWLTVFVPADPERHILLEKPGPPSMSDETAAEVRATLTKGATGLALILSTDDCRKTYDDLVAKGVETTQEPTEQPYGIDCGIRDPFGNHIRISQPSQGMGEITDEVKERWASE